MEGIESWAQLMPILESLPRAEVEVRPQLAPPSPFVLGAMEVNLKQEVSKYEETFKSLLKLAKEGRSNAEQRWKIAQAAYECRYDFGFKSAHQAKAYIPRLTRNVDVVSQYLRRMLVENQQFFTVTTPSSRLEDIANAAVIQRLVQFIVERNNLDEQFTKLAKIGLLYGIVVMKVYVAPRKVTHVIVGDDGKIRSVERNSYFVKLELVHPQDFYIDPTGLNKFVIQRILVEKSDLYDFVDLQLLDRDAVEKLIAKGEGHLAKVETPLKTPKERPMFMLFEYWGDWWDDDGNLLHRNIWAIFGAVIGADGNELPDFVLLKGPMPNPYWHQKPPFVWSSFSPLPSKAVYPMSVSDFLVDLQREYTRLVNAMIDGAIFDAVNLFEVNELMAEDAKELDEIWSGKIIRRRGDQPVITPVQLGKMPTAASFMLQLMERYLLEGFGVTETVLGYLSSRGRPTATEVMTARAHAFSAIEEMGRMVESNFMEPLLERVFQVAMQVLPDLADEEMLNALGDMSPTLRRLMSLSAEEREALVRGGYRFQVRGMSMALTKAQELARINEFIQIAAQIPQFATQINWTMLLRKIVEAYGWSPDEVLLQQPTPVIPPTEVSGSPSVPTQEAAAATGHTTEEGAAADIAGMLQGLEV
jgi:hypothetical protein